MLAFDTLSVACGATFPVGEGFYMRCCRKKNIQIIFCNVS